MSGTALIKISVNLADMSNNIFQLTFLMFHKSEKKHIYCQPTKLHNKADLSCLQPNFNVSNDLSLDFNDW